VSHTYSIQFYCNAKKRVFKKRQAYYVVLTLVAIFYAFNAAQAQAVIEPKEAREVEERRLATKADNIGQQNNRPIDIPVDLIAKQKTDKSTNSLAGVYGSISSVGSDTLATLVSLWAQRFKSVYPHVKFQIQASGSATAPQALTQGTATIGPMSRALTTSETNRFTQKYGYPPTTLIVAVDAIAIYVEKNNPIRALSLEQVDALFSATRFCGSKEKLSKWIDLGVTKFGESRNVLLYGRNSASGTYDLFKQQALCEGDFKTTVNELPGSSSVVLSIASSLGGMGYAALGHSDENVKALSIGVRVPLISPALTFASNNTDVLARPGDSEEPADYRIEYIEPNTENITLDRYPFSRYLYIVVNKPPNKALPILERAFLRFILSEEGQNMVRDNGYYSVNQTIVDKQLALISK
jgi:phosphate transport system substrate-binding protein